MTMHGCVCARALVCVVSRLEKPANVTAGVIITSCLENYEVISSQFTTTVTKLQPLLVVQLLVASIP